MNVTLQQGLALLRHNAFPVILVLASISASANQDSVETNAVAWGDSVRTIRIGLSANTNASIVGRSAMVTFVMFNTGTNATQVAVPTLGMNVFPKLSFGGRTVLEKKQRHDDEVLLRHGGKITVVEPGKTISLAIDLMSLFDITESGDYQVTVEMPRPRGSDPTHIKTGVLTVNLAVSPK